MTDTEIAEPRKAPARLDRPSDRTPDEREDHYESWMAQYGDPYVAAVVAGGGTPWFNSDEERRQLFMRRYKRPAPPEGMTTNPPWRAA
jgi:hypothetical protein